MALERITPEQLTVALNAAGIDSKCGQADVELANALVAWLEANIGHHPSLPADPAPLPVQPVLPPDVQKDLDKLAALEAGGVHNWDWYDYSLQAWREQYKDD